MKTDDCTNEDQNVKNSRLSKGKGNSQKGEKVKKELMA